MIEGVFKLVMLVGYMALVSRMKEIARMFRYHGAEHKTIACYESGRGADRRKRAPLYPFPSALRHQLC